MSKYCIFRICHFYWSMDSIILLHGALVNSKFRPLGTLIPDFGSTKLLQIIQEQFPNRFGNVFGHLRISRIANFGKDACRTILEIRLIRSCNSWIWDQDLSKNMKWTSWIFNSIKGIPPTPIHPWIAENDALIYRGLETKTGLHNWNKRPIFVLNENGWRETMKVFKTYISIIFQARFWSFS